MLHVCQNCGAFLSPETKLCKRCGAPYHANNASDLNNPYNYYDSQLPTEIYTPLPDSSLSIEDYKAQVYKVNQFANTPLPAVYTPPKPVAHKARRIPKLVFIASSILALISMSAGVWIIYYTTHIRPMQLQVQATATITSYQRQTAQVTATVKAQATHQAQTQADATATVSAQAQATATITQQIYTRWTSGNPVLNSELDNQDSALWDVYDASDGGGCTFADEALHARIEKKSYYVPCFAQNTNFANMAFQVEMTILKGDEGGLIFRADDRASKFYYFGVGSDGSYSLVSTQDNARSTPLASDSSSAIRKTRGQSNLLTVVADGPEIYLYINKQFVDSVENNTYSNGKIGLYAANINTTTEVAFQNAMVWSR